MCFNNFYKKIYIIFIIICMKNVCESADNNENYLNIDAGDLVARISYLEEKIRFLSGKVEELEHLKQEINNKLELYEKNTKEVIANLQTSIIKQNSNVNAKNLNDSLTKEKINDHQDDNLATQKYTAILALLNAKKYSEAEIEMLNFLKEFNKNKYSAKIYFTLGELKYNKGLYEGASIQYLYCQKYFPESDFAPRALFKLSLCLEKIKKLKDMCVILNKFTTEYPNADKKILELAKSKKISQNCQ